MDFTSGLLVLVRHGESLWNAKQVWTGLTDIGLSPRGEEEARNAAHALRDLSFDSAFTSNLRRAQETLRLMLETLGKTDVPITRDAALNERDYGVYTGKNKMEIKSELGDAEFLKLRRGWDYPVPHGESLKQVYARVVPYYVANVEPLVKAGKHVLVVAHGNSLRALIKKLDNVNDADIANVELATGDIVVYYIDASGRIVSRELRKASA